MPDQNVEETTEASEAIYRTRFYSDCIGVFQGGGCRAAAYGGAYDAVYKCGVRFSEVAGTSAGAIVSALIAAGAEPQFLLERLTKLNFASLLEKPVHPTFSHVASRISMLRIVPFKGNMIRSIVKFARLGGLHSSAGVEKWVEECLKELTGKTTGPVEFRDLIMPLHVVAGDLSTMKARVWSSRTTPTHSVAHAVRSSCTIPLFFQPVEEGSALLVDGGIVSNIPHFLFTGEGMRAVKGRKRVILFMLEATEARARAENLEEFAAQLASLVVDGGTDVQLAFTPDLARISIPTGSVRATDFLEMDTQKTKQLIKNGRNAADTFIKRELLNTHGAAIDLQPIADEHEAYLAVSEQLYATGAEVRVSMPDTKWFWELFPTVLHWRRAKIRIAVFVPPLIAGSREAAAETQRRGYLVGLGAEVFETRILAFHGILFDTPPMLGASALAFNPEPSDYEAAARFYSGRIDAAALNALHRLLPTLPTRPTCCDFQPKIHRIDPETLLRLLRENVHFYRDPHVTLSIEEVPISNIHLISRYVRAFRYKQISALLDAYQEDGLELFEPSEVKLFNGGSSLITPPVVEQTGSEFIALEGNTRFLYCQKNGIDRLKAVVVRGVNVELPGRPVPLNHVTITTIKHPPADRIVGLNRSLFREIERAVRPLPVP